jgi:hypothetical protein
MRDVWVTGVAFLALASMTALLLCAVCVVRLVCMGEARSRELFRPVSRPPRVEASTTIV